MAVPAGGRLRYDGAAVGGSTRRLGHRSGAVASSGSGRHRRKARRRRDLQDGAGNKEQIRRLAVVHGGGFSEELCGGARRLYWELDGARPGSASEQRRERV
ncbi:hypothetical protein M6B38_106045 [Iris pallida]|uniref:Uncharacterized protein n=1 Tax=Iris pallida TaxID=29817 RepID=A0AAX6ES18_IRIPA|nr:hypothetical protein M6B38_106045 [Iris pallida]